MILTNPKQRSKTQVEGERNSPAPTTRYGILTEYTAFLAQDSHRSLNQTEQIDMAYRNFDERAVKTRVGLSSVNQSINNTIQQRQHFLNGGNYYWDANMRLVTVPNVRQLSNGAFFLQGSTWVDGRLVGRPNVAPQEIVPFESAAYEKLLNQLTILGEQCAAFLKRQCVNGNR